MRTRFAHRWLLYAAMLCVGATLSMAVSRVYAEESGQRLYLGVMLHDRGPFADRQEDGVDLNIEMEFSPLHRWPGAPRVHLGTTPSFIGETSLLYGGLSYDWDLGPRWFWGLGFGLALHDGDLRNPDRRRCDVNDDCGFGSRILPRVAFEVGRRTSTGEAITFFFDHVSHYGWLDDENEGIEHIGLRYRRPFP